MLSVHETGLVHCFAFIIWSISFLSFRSALVLYQRALDLNLDPQEFPLFDEVRLHLLLVCTYFLLGVVVHIPYPFAVIVLEAGFLVSRVTCACVCALQMGSVVDKATNMIDSWFN